MAINKYDVRLLAEYHKTCVNRLYSVCGCQRALIDE